MTHRQTATATVSPRDAVADVLARYAWGFCRSDFALLRSCFTPETKVAFPNGPQEGIEAVMAELRARRARWDGEWIYVTNILVIDAQVDEIVAHACNAVVGKSQDAHVFAAVGWYQDRFRFDAGSWRIHERGVFLGSPAQHG
jgi:hypothetical protein